MLRIRIRYANFSDARTLTSLLLASLFATGVFAQTVSQTPLITKQTAEANIVLTVDDGANMAKAYAPDSLVPDPANPTDSAKRRFKSSQFNALYYNPAVRYVIPPNADSVVSGVYAAAWTGFTTSNVFVNGFASTQGTVDVLDDWRPTLRYAPVSPVAVPVQQLAAASVDDGKAYYTTLNPNVCSDPANDSCYTVTPIVSGGSYKILSPNTRSDCTTSNGTTTCSYAQESLNFAIWYSFYRTRNLQMISTTALAFSQPSLQGTRVGWQTVNSACGISGSATCTGWDGTTSNGRLQTFDATRLALLNTFLSRVGAMAGAGSPLRTATQRVGQFYSTPQSGSNPFSPYLKDPLTQYGASNPEYSCRPNFHVLMTSGYYDDNDSGSYCGSSCGNFDSGSRTLPGPDSKSYSGMSPYADTNSNSLADVAMYYWATDLRTDLINNLTPYYPDRSGNGDDQYWNARNDPARWQHMVNFIVGIGLTPSTFDVPSLTSLKWGTDAFNPANPTLLSSVTAGLWPAAGASAADPGRAYDLWHAALNSRGNFYVGASPDTIVGGLKSAITRVSSQTSYGAALATNSTRLTKSAVLYQASFDNNDWTGELIAVEVRTDGALGGQLWSASGQIPPAGTRKIFTADASYISSSGISGMAVNTAAPLNGVGVSFDWTSLPSAMKTLIDTSGNSSSTILSYLRGDQSNEGNGSTQFRPRSRRLGDIVNSDIAFTSNENFGYQNLLPENGNSTTYYDSYSPFVTAKKDRAKMIYVGSNDGMLHGIDADSGIERFAYVPLGALLPNRDTTAPANMNMGTSRLTQLSDNSVAPSPYNANHRFYEDGSPWVGDACLTVDPSASPPGAPTQLPQCIKWATLVVGATGAGGKGVFALDVTDPTNFDSTKVLWDLTGTNVAGTTDNDLGYTFGQPVIGRLPDNNWYAIFGNGYGSVSNCSVLYLVRLDTGAVRKITASCPAKSTGATGLGRPSLYAGAGDRVTTTIYAGSLGGNIWRFDVSNTDPTKWTVSKFFTATDASGKVQQPITGLIEIGRPPPGQIGVMLYFGTGEFFATGDDTNTATQTFYGLWDDGSRAASSRSNLVKRTITPDSTGNRTITPLTTSPDNSVKYTSTGSSNFGFYLDFPASGERMVNAPVLLPGRVLMATLIPSADPCFAGGTSAIMAVDPFNGTAIRLAAGGSTTTSIFNTQYDSVMSTVDIVKNLVAIDSGTNVYLYAGGSSGQIQTIKTAALQPSDSAYRGRVSWREIFQ